MHEMLRRIEERLMLVLTVEFEKAVPQVLERRRRRERVVDERAAPALRGNLAAHDLFAAVGAFEDRLHGGRLFSGTNEVRTGATAKERVEMVSAVTAGSSASEGMICRPSNLPFSKTKAIHRARSFADELMPPAGDCGSGKR